MKKPLFEKDSFLNPWTGTNFFKNFKKKKKKKKGHENQPVTLLLPYEEPLGPLLCPLH